MEKRTQGMNWLPKARRLAIYLRAGLACAYCGASVEDDARLSLDHLRPYSKGGTNETSNLVTACGRCNSSRGTRTVRGFCRFDEVLQKQERRLASFDGEVLLDFLALFAPERRIGKDHLEAVFVLNVANVLGQGVGVEDVGRFDAMQDHVHDADDIGQALLFFARERLGLQGLELAGGEVAVP